MKEIKLGDMVTATKNSRTQQISFCLKARQLKKRKITPQELLDIVIPKIKTKPNFRLKKPKVFPLGDIKNKNDNQK